MNSITPSITTTATPNMNTNTNSITTTTTTTSSSSLTTNPTTTENPGGSDDFSSSNPTLDLTEPNGDAFDKAVVGSKRSEKDTWMFVGIATIACLVCSLAVLVVLVIRRHNAAKIAYEEQSDEKESQASVQFNDSEDGNYISHDNPLNESISEDPFMQDDEDII